jgi:hypothetical protein
MPSRSVPSTRSWCPLLIAALAACAAPAPTGPGSDTPAAALASLALEPDSFYVVQQESFELTAVGRTAAGDEVRPRIQWTATGGAVDAAGRFTAGVVPGVYAVTASAGGHFAEAVVLLDYRIVQIVIAPASVSLAPGAIPQVTARGVTVTGDTVAIDVVWSATGGTITSGGLFTAGSSGTPRVMAELAPPSFNGQPVEFMARRSRPSAWVD